MSTAPPPAPMEWHPYYRDKTWLWDWLESTERHVVYEAPRSLRVEDYTATTPVSAPANRQVVLTKQTAQGPAPWTERPYVYVWKCAVDDLGRSIAGEAHPRFLALPPWEAS